MILKSVTFGQTAQSVWDKHRAPVGESWFYRGTFPCTGWNAWCSLVLQPTRIYQTRTPDSLGEEKHFLFKVPLKETRQNNWKESSRLLTVELVKVLELRCSLHCVVEMRFQRSASQEAVGHLCQVNPNYGVRIPGTWNDWSQQTCETERVDITGTDLIVHTGIEFLTPV